MTSLCLSAALQEEVDGVVRALRPRRFAPFHVESVARRLGITVERRRLGVELLGLTLDGGTVLLNRRHPGGTNPAFTFAHEVAHVMEGRGFFSGVPVNRREWFADGFARELLVPRTWLIGAAPEEIKELVAKRWVSPEVVCLQAATIGRAPEVFRRGASVLCRDCGERHGLPGCRCFGVRTRPSKAQRLPTLASVLSAVTRPSVCATPLSLPV